MAVTIQQIAEQAGVSRGTVDRALNHRGRINPEVAERICRLADEMGYVQKERKHSRTAKDERLKIGVVTQLARSSFMQEVNRGIEKAAVELKEKGMQFPDLVEAVSDYLENHVRVFFALKSMTNLANNGRVSPAVAKIAGLLKIWVYGWAEEGEIKPLGKARGEKKTLAALLRTLEEKGYRGGRVKIDHADNFDSAAELHDLIRKKRPEARVDLGTCRALCSFYAEAGGLMIGVEI